MNRNGNKLKDSKYQSGTRASRPSHRPRSSGPDSQLMAPPASEGTTVDDAMEAQSLHLGEGGWVREVISSCGAGEGRDTETPRSSQLYGSDSAGLMHELSNTMTAVLVNARLLEWRLPPYSRLKRPVLEVERNAQRSGELLKRLQLFGASGSEFETTAGPRQGCSASMVVTAQEPGATAVGKGNLPQSAVAAAAPGFSMGRHETHKRL